MYPTMYPWFRIYHKISHEPRRSSESLALTISPPSFTRDLPSPKLCFDISNNIRPTMAASCSSTRETFRPLIAKLLIRIVDRSWRFGERLKSLEIAWQMCVCFAKMWNFDSYEWIFPFLRSWTQSFTRPLSCKLIARVCRFLLIFSSNFLN